MATTIRVLIYRQSSPYEWFGFRCSVFVVQKRCEVCKIASDVGMTGPHDSVIGMQKESVLQRFLDALPARFVVAEGDVQMNTVLIDVDESTGRARSIERLNFRLD